MNSLKIDDVPIIFEDDVKAAEIIFNNRTKKEHEITNKFLAGKLSFSEYAAQLEEDEVADPPKDADVPSEPGGTEEPSTSKPDTEKRIVRRKKQVLPPTLKGLVGEANLRYARGDHKTAEKMCLEVIRQVPTAAEPFLTLGQIYENENPEKSLQFNLIAAHLSPNNEEQWIRLGYLSEELQNFRQADTCYAKAILINPTNIEVHFKRIHFLESINEPKQAIKAKVRALNHMTEDHYQMMIPLAKELAKQFHVDGEIQKAIDAMDTVFKKIPQHVTSELVNIMLELLLQIKNYKYCLEILVEHCCIDIELETREINSETTQFDNIEVISYSLTNEIPIDLHIKFIICMIHLKAFHFIDALLQPLFAEDENVEKDGDLYLDVAEALMVEQRYEDALKLLVPLVKSDNFGLAAVWLRYAECLKECKLYEKSIESYKEVMKLAPQHVEMRHPLAVLLISLDRKEEALSILKQDETMEEIDSRLLFLRCKLLKELKYYREFWKAGLLLISRNHFVIRNKDEVTTLTGVQQHIRKGGILKALRITRGEDPIDVPAIYNNHNEPSIPEEYALLRELMETTMNNGRYDLMQRFSFTILGSKRFKEYMTEIEMWAIYSCFRNEDYFNGYNLIHNMLNSNILNITVWNMYNLMIQKSDDSRHNRFLMRLLCRQSIDLKVHILQANNCLVAGTYKYAFYEYMELYRKKAEPLSAFLNGVTLFQIASQKFSAKKDYLVLQGMGFFNIYKKLRGPDGYQEAHYNIGRGYHQLGMMHMAVEYYKKVLNSRNDFVDKYPHLFDLKREAAYNLHLIYKESGSHELAKMCLQKYIVI